MYNSHIERPQILGGYSLDKDRKYDHSLKGMKYLAIQKEKLPMDLNVGFYQYKPYTSPDGLEFVYKFIENEFERLYDSEEEKLPFHFVSMRGVFKDLICTLYKNDSWIILATKFRGTIYLQKVITEEKIHYEQNKSNYVKKCEFYGKKFESLVMSDKPDEASQSNAVYNGGELTLALTTKYGDFKLFYCAETDCVEGSTEGQPLQDLKFVKIKTSRDANFKNPNRVSSMKLLNWWCQCYLTGIEKIYCGLRTKEGAVHNIEHLKVEEIPLNCRRKWSDSEALNNGLNFLKEVDKEMAGIDCPYTVVRFSFNPKSNPKLTVKVFKSGNRSKHSFLPEEYISLFRYDLVRGIERIDLNCQD